MASTSTTVVSDGSPSLSDYLNLANTFSNIGARNQNLQDRRKKILEESQTNELIKQWDNVDPTSEDFQETVSAYRQSPDYNSKVEEAATLHLLNRSKNWIEYDTNLAEAELKEGLSKVGEARRVFLSGDENSARSMLAEINNTNPVIPYRVEFEGDGQTIHYFNKADNEYVGSKPMPTEDMFKIAVQLSQPNQYLGARVAQLAEVGKQNIESFLNADIFTDESNSVVGRGYIKRDKMTGEEVLSFTYTDGTTVQGQEAQDVISSLNQVGGVKLKEGLGTGTAALQTQTADTKELKAYLTNRDQAIKDILSRANIAEEPQKVAEALRDIDKKLRNKLGKGVPLDAGAFVDQVYNIYSQAYSMTQENLAQKEQEGFFKKKGNSLEAERDKVFRANLNALMDSYTQGPKEQPRTVVSDALANLQNAQQGSPQRAPLADTSVGAATFEEALSQEPTLSPLDELPVIKPTKRKLSFGRVPTGREKTTLK